MSTYTTSKDFEEAAQYLSSAPSLAKVSNNVKLELYGLFKCLTVSPIPNTTCPSIFDMTGRAKWNSWQSIGKTYSNNLPGAEGRYLELARDLGWKPGSTTTEPPPKGTAEANDDDDIWDKESDTRKGSSGGMGNKVSTVSYGDEGERKGVVHNFAVDGDAGSLRRYLVDHPDADINAKDEYGYTLLHLASDRGHTEIVKLLLERGVDTTIKDPDDLTAKELAEVAEKNDIIEMLKEVP